MIPFNHLGPLFKHFSGNIYSPPVKEALSRAVTDVPTGGAVLDVGAGTGTLSDLVHAIREDLALVALDPAQGMLRYAAEYISPTVGRAEAIPFSEGSFRAVLVGEAVHHFAAPRKAFREIARVLEPGGTLFIFEFDPRTFLGGMICRAERLLGEPGNFFPPETLCRLLGRAGFRAEYARFGWRYVIRARLER